MIFIYKYPYLKMYLKGIIKAFNYLLSEILTITFFSFNMRLERGQHIQSEGKMGVGLGWR